MPVKSTSATPTKTRKTRTRKTSPTATRKVATPAKATAPKVKVAKVKPVQNSKIRTLKSVKRPSTARLISTQRYIQDIKTRWEIHNYEITMLISDLTKGFKAVQPYHAQVVKTVKAWTV
tara:strand:+ start:203 stop:559 length:357 start_codon:yes stop_codon:yes gene_type:complete